MRWVMIASVVPGLMVQPVTAAASGNIKFAMHVVATAESLGCNDLTPLSCDSINVDISAAELEASDGYGYVLFLAYDADIAPPVSLDPGLV